MTDIFISYARSTAAQAHQVAESLRALGYGVWRDDELPAHRSYTEVIEERLKAAKAVVVIWSAEAAKSEWVQSEADRAREDHKLVQLSVDGTRLPMPFDRIQCVNLAGWSGDTEAAGWRTVTASIADLMGVAGRPLSPTPARASPAANPTGPLLAVLAFDNLSGDPEVAYFSDGVSEEILQTVTQTTGLTVIGRSSSLQFRGPDKNARHVAAELGCTHVLDGSVRRSGDRVRIAANLIECSGQTTLWSDRFDRDLSDVFALQDEIASAVAGALKATFAPSASLGPIAPAAYDLYLRARAASPGELGAFDAGLLRQATALAPNFAQAWSALALTRALQAIAGQASGPARKEAEEAARKALALDANSGSAYAALALLTPICGHFQETEALFQKALLASPDDPDSLEKYSRWLHGVGRSTEAFESISRAYGIDPLYHQGANWYAVLLSQRGGLAEALDVWEKARARWPSFDILTINPIHTAVTNQDWDQFERLVDEAKSHGLDTPKLRAAIRAGEEARHPSPQSATAQLERLNAQIADGGIVSLNGLLAVYALGLRDEAFDLVGRASFERLFRPGGRLRPEDYGLHVLFNRSNGAQWDARFVGLCAKLGLCGYWLNSGQWPDIADDPTLTYDFRAECLRESAA